MLYAALFDHTSHLLTIVTPQPSQSDLRMWNTLQCVVMFLLHYTSPFAWTPQCNRSIISAFLKGEDLSFRTFNLQDLMNSVFLDMDFKQWYYYLAWKYKMCMYNRASLQEQLIQPGNSWMSFINWLLTQSDHKQYSLIRSLEFLSRYMTHWVTKEEGDVFIDKL